MTADGSKFQGANSATPGVSTPEVTFQPKS